MGNYIDSKGNICYIRTGYNMTGNHGNHEQEHKEDIEQICNEIVIKQLEAYTRNINETLPQRLTEICVSVWNDTANRVLAAFTQETHTAVKLSFQDGIEILAGEKTRKIITDEIAKAAQAELKKIKPIVLK